MLNSVGARAAQCEASGVLPCDAILAGRRLLLLGYRRIAVLGELEMLSCVALLASWRVLRRQYLELTCSCSLVRASERTARQFGDEQPTNMQRMSVRDLRDSISLWYFALRAHIRKQFRAMVSL
eukprot:6173823-Pleurochrysis_carterae.AAC.2